MQHFDLFKTTSFYLEKISPIFSSRVWLPVETGDSGPDSGPAGLFLKRDRKPRGPTPSGRQPLQPLGGGRMTPLELRGSWKTRRSADQREFQRRSGSPAGACGPWEGLPSPAQLPLEPVTGYSLRIVPFPQMSVNSMVVFSG